MALLIDGKDVDGFVWSSTMIRGIGNQGSEETPLMVLT